MVNDSSRWACVCCALPARLVRHVHAVAGHAGEAAAEAHEKTTADLRASRHARRRSHDAARREIYDAGGGKKLPGVVARVEGQRAVGDRVVNDAYRNIGVTLDFFRKVLGRDSLDDKGMGVRAAVHFGREFPNAMWTGREMLFGDGDGVNILGFANALDIVGHELAHAVTQNCVHRGLGVVKSGGQVNLVGQAGALNESFSDVFASLIKQWHGKQTTKEASWLVGEGVLAPHVGRAVRSLKDPGNARHTYPDDNQAKDMRGYEEGADAHTNSGIPNHAFYLAATRLGGHAWEQLGPVWYQALGALKHDASFRDAAQATGEAAARLHGAGSAAQRAVVAAWTRVGVLG